MNKIIAPPLGGRQTYAPKAELPAGSDAGVIDLSLFKRKAVGYECLGPSTVADAVTFEHACAASTWVATRYKAKPDDEFIARWQLAHTAVLNQTVELIKAEYPNAKIEVEIPLESVGLCGNTLFGAPDLLVRFDDNSLIIVDAKSGRRKQTHWIQVGLYAIMLQAMARAAGEPVPDIRGFVLSYGDGQGGDCELVSIVGGDDPLAEVLPEATRKRIRAILAESSQKEIPAAQPSSSECRYCKWQDGCSVSMKRSMVAIDATDLL